MLSRCIVTGDLGCFPRTYGGSFRSLPFAGAWTGTRDLPAPEGQTFQALYDQKTKRGGR